MGKIISGGFKGLAPVKSQPQRSIQNQPQSTEGYGGYFARNIAKIPAQFAASTASGFGIGDLINYINRAGQSLIGDRSQLQGPPETRSAFPAQRLAPNVLKALTQPEVSIPSRGQALSGIESLLSSTFSPETARYLTESRPGDYPAELIANELPFAVGSLLSGGLSGILSKGLPALGRYGALSAGAHAGAAGGGALGGELGELLGNREVGETLGRIPGAIVGAKLGKVATRSPLRVLPSQVTAAEKAAFEKGQLGELAAAKAEFDPKIQAATEAERRAALELPKTKTGFEKAQHKQVQSVRNEIKNYDNKIKSLDSSRKPAYDAAKKLEGNARGRATLINQALEDIQSDLLTGVNPADAKKIDDSIFALRENIFKNKGELSLTDAKKFQKNFNDQIYNFGESITFKRQLGKATQALNEFIKETGGPEHYNEWVKGEVATQELKALQKGRKEFLRDKNNEIRDLSREKFSPEKEFNLKREHKETLQELKSLQQERSKVIESIGKKTFDDILKLRKEIEDNANITEKAIAGANKYGLGGLALTLGSIFGGLKTGSILGLAGQAFNRAKREIQYVRQVFKNHPEIYREYANFIKRIPKLEKAAIINGINSLGEKIENIPQGQPKESVTKGRILKGGYK